MTSQVVLEVYTDGACSSNGFKGARAGIGVHWPHDSTRDLSLPVEGAKQSNNVAELQALGAAFDAIAKHWDADALLHGDPRYVVHSDSMYSLKALTEWLPSWLKKGRTDVQNLELIMSVADKLRVACPATDPGRVTLKHVYGHRDCAGNNRADALARAASSAGPACAPPLQEPLTRVAKKIKEPRTSKRESFGARKRPRVSLGKE